MSKFRIQSQFASDVFTLNTMKRHLPPETMAALEKTINKGDTLNRTVAREVARIMLDWAIEKGASHYTHWFQPLTGMTAEKHESFIHVSADQQASMRFSTEELILGEPDASSFPSGGLRATFEARGYTAWDPTSPAFIIRGKSRATLCIPSIFLGYHSEALDKKTPLLRSIRVLSRQLQRLEGLLGDSDGPGEGDARQQKSGKRSPYATLGTEQEYFLIDKKYYDQRPDLVQTGRTLFGSLPVNHQQQADHYFGTIKSRVIAFMEELDEQLWALGIPVKTRHNEVAPAQYELAPIFEEMNLAVDHNMLTMDVMKRVAEQHDLVILLHEKPFAGINGSGKHNNWSVVGSDGQNWLQAGSHLQSNAKFLTLMCAVIQGVCQNEDLLRVSIASSGNDLRLGGNEAPPPIISIFLGDHLSGVLEQVISGTEASSKVEDFLKSGVDRIPNFKRDTSDRNRTSPLAFTGEKFEFRAVGANLNPAGPNIILNLIVADALDAIASKLEKTRGVNAHGIGTAAVGAGVRSRDSRGDFKKIPEDLREILHESWQDHKHILFNGNNYSPAWEAEARKRKLSQYRNTAEALQVLKSDKNIYLFEKHQVLSRKEQDSRYEVYLQRYYTEIDIERQCALRMAKSLIVPACVHYMQELRNCDSMTQKKLYTKISNSVDQILEYISELEKLNDTEKQLQEIHEKMAHLRSGVDALEDWIPQKTWPLPSYDRMLLQSV